MNKTVIDCVEREEKTIYMSCIRPRSLKRSKGRLREHLGNLLLAIAKLPRGPYLLKLDELRSCEPYACS